MGGTQKTTTVQNTATEPWKVAQPALGDILSSLGGIDASLTGNQREAISQMVALARAGNPYAPAIDSYATTMLAGGGPDRTGLLTDAYERYKRDLEGTARGDMLDPNRNPWFADVSNNIASTVTNNLAGLYAASGRAPDGAGSFAQNVGKGVAEGVAPMFSNAYNTERANQIAAQNALFGAGTNMTSLLSGLDQTRLANMGQGINAAQQAINAQLDPWNRLLAAEQLYQTTPLSILQNLASIAVPIAQLGQQTSGTTNTTQQMSGAQQFATIASGLGSLFGGGRSGGGSTASFA